MTLRTAFTELVGVRHPIALAPMGGTGQRSGRPWRIPRRASFRPRCRRPRRTDSGFGCGRVADGRGLAAALALSASGALVGTRFQASHEALVDAEVVKAI